MSIVPRDPHEPVTDEQWSCLRESYPDGGRLLAAFALALDAGTCSDLLAGRTVPPDRLDPVALVHARERSLVQLRTPLDLLAKESA